MPDGEAEAENSEPKKEEISSETKSDSNPESSVTPEPADASDPSNTSAPASKAKKRKSTVLDIVLGTLILSILAVLFMNVAVLHLAKDYNKRCCKTAIYLAGKGAVAGKDTNGIANDALHYLDGCALPGLFVERPIITEFSDEITPGMRSIKISMNTRTLLPAPFLVADHSAFEPDLFHVNCATTYVFNLKNPKNCDGAHKIYKPSGGAGVQNGAGIQKIEIKEPQSTPAPDKKDKKAN